MTMLNLVRQSYCGLHGHDNLLEFRQDRLLLKCASCDHETPGWELRDTAPKAIPAVSQKLRLLTTELAGRRVA